MTYGSTIYFDIYKLFNDPPGTPKDLKCVKCKIAVGTLFLGIAGVGCIGAKRVMHRSVFQMVSFLGVTVFSTFAGVISYRIAYEHSQYNENLIAIRAKQISAERKENRQKLQQQQQ